VIDYVREAGEQLREQVPAGRQALAEKKQALTDVKARLARYHERFERAGNAGEEDLAWERIKELREQEAALKAEIAGLESQQIPSSDRDLDAVRARRYLRTLARFFRSRPRYEESLYEALHQHHGFRVAVLIHVPRGLCIECIAVKTSLSADGVTAIIEGLERTLRIVPSRSRCALCKPRPESSRSRDRGDGHALFRDRGRNPSVP
jgi:hypothetical protein